MEFSIKAGSAAKQRTGCVVVGAFEGRKLAPSAQALDAAAGKYLAAIVKRGDLEGPAGRTLLLHDVPNLEAERVLVVNLGPEDAFGPAAYRNAASAAARALKATGTTEVAFFLAELPVKDRDIAWKVEQAVLAFAEAAYR